MIARFPNPLAVLRWLYVRATMGATWLYVAAFALVGFEALDLIWAFTVWAPEFVPVVILLLALIYVVRRRLRRGRAGQPAPAIEGDVAEAE